MICNDSVLLGIEMNFVADSFVDQVLSDPTFAIRNQIGSDIATNKELKY
jgi:hypothetical protein